MAALAGCVARRDRPSFILDDPRPKARRDLRRVLIPDDADLGAICKLSGWPLTSVRGQIRWSQATFGSH
jgi:hypothetical protein